MMVDNFDDLISADHIVLNDSDVKFDIEQDNELKRTQTASLMKAIGEWGCTTEQLLNTLKGD